MAYVCMLSCVQLFTTPWTVAHQAHLSIGFSRQEYWSGLPFPTWGDLPNPGIEPMTLALQVDSLPSEPKGKLHEYVHHVSCPVLTESQTRWLLLLGTFGWLHQEKGYLKLIHSSIWTLDPRVSQFTKLSWFVIFPVLFWRLVSFPSSFYPYSFLPSFLFK